MLLVHTKASAGRTALSLIRLLSGHDTVADVSPAKAKPLHILPNLAEEDECRRSLRLESPPSSSTSSFYGSRSVGGSATLGCRLSTDVLDIKRISRRVVLTGAEGLTFDDFFPMSSAPTPPRPAPAPPLFGPATSCESPLDDINLRFSGLGISSRTLDTVDFPFTASP
ncbi:hypothetical protein A0H81_02701 [Grifola frondosa]|uniref:Uncharacterized protein n=1 Tax=Grifola frondosa TaxID=5627 RepID=A0A1C7MM00_GRIFR|nr:hypothetical protein A0H81_02701 [Grifola frondosa]